MHDNNTVQCGPDLSKTSLLFGNDTNPHKLFKCGMLILSPPFKPN